MTREDYLAELRGRLSGRVLPEELERLMAYYEEYFDEAGPAREGEIINELGSPEALVHRIMGESQRREEPRYTPPTGGYESYPPPSGPPERRRWKPWMIVLVICLSPIIIPLVIAAVAVAFGLAVAVFGVVLGVGLAGIVCIAAGIFSAVCGLSVLFSAGLTTTMFFAGTGLLCAGLGLLMIAGMVALGGLCFKALGRLIFGRRARV